MQYKTINILLFFSLLFLTACSTKKLIQEDGTATLNLKKRSSKYLLKKLNAKTLEVEWLSARARITYKDEAQTRKFNATIRVRKDSVIWMNVKKLSVEAFRILITQDSIFIIDRLEKKYYTHGLDYIEEKFNFPGQFQALQTAILGNPYFLAEQKLSASIADQQYQLISGTEIRTRSTYLLNGLDYSLEKMSFFDVERNRKLAIDLSDYITVVDQLIFPHKRTYTIESKETGVAKIDMKFSKVQLNTPKSIIFSVSDRYERIVDFEAN